VTADRQYGMPLPHPLDVEPSADSIEADEMWRIAVRHIGDTGRWDRLILAWIQGKDAGTTATVASWLLRAWQAGRAAGLVAAADAGQDDEGAAGLSRYLADAAAPHPCIRCGHRLGEHGGAGCVNDTCTCTVGAADDAGQDDDPCEACGERPARLVEVEPDTVPQALCQDCEDDVAYAAEQAWDDGGHVSVLLPLLVCLAAGVLAWLPVLPATAQALAAVACAVAGWVAVRRTDGTCAVCGRPGAGSDPLTVGRRPRVHIRHVPAMRASRRASLAAVEAARRDDTTGGAR
jgi:hypothetical protein